MSNIGVCVIGSGRAGMIHAVNFVKNVPGAKLVAMVDPIEETAKTACAQLGIDTYYTDYRQALADKSIDAVVIVTPTKFHVDIAVDAAAAGKHILCEKPMAMTVEECRKMSEAAANHKVALQIGFMRRFDAGFIQAKEIVDSGAIGDVVMVRSNTRGPSIPQPWMYDIQKSNGPLAEVNSHDIDTLRWFTGSEFSTVYAIGGNYRSPEAKQEYPDFYDNVIVAASFENGMQGMIDGAQGVGYAYDSRVEVLGTKGCVYIGRINDNAVLTCTADSKHGSYPLVSSWTKLFKDAYLAEDVAFIDCIRNGTTPKVTGHDGEMAVKVVAAGNRSIIEKKIIHLDTM
ncbi:MAG: Gfo/Idh/MocA family oxidoreductase [Oscillospiraceae bacterium]|nr:Gfo/Idh/MocA family oxidoreductase [Oscillospiraceae bacterium]